MYHQYIRAEQFGAAKRRSSTFASHMSQTFVERCRMHAMSYFLLSVDLIKAFDIAIREILLGWPQGLKGDKVEY